MALGWVLTAYADESATTGTDRQYVLQAGDNSFAPVAQIANPDWVDDGVQSDPDTNGNARYLANPDAQTITDNEQGGQVYLDSDVTIEQARELQGQFQQEFTDRDVRMERVDITLAFV